jgi:uncharacterized membrane protein YhhN
MKYIFFVILLFVEIAATFFENRLGVYVLKPLLMPFLAIIYLSELSFKVNRNGFLYLVCLFFCFLGDVFLMFDGQLYFVLGLGSFLIGHILYIVQFYSPIQWKNLTFFILFGLGFYVLLFNSLSDVLVYAVFIYAMAISLMWAFSYNHIGYNKLIFIGASLFVFSDSIIGINKFIFPIPLSSFWVMLPYGLGQLLQLKGILKINDSKIQE